MTSAKVLKRASRRGTGTRIAKSGGVADVRIDGLSNQFAFTACRLAEPDIVTVPKRFGNRHGVMDPGAGALDVGAAVVAVPITADHGSPPSRRSVSARITGAKSSGPNHPHDGSWRTPTPISVPPQEHPTGATFSIKIGRAHV